MLAIAFCAKNSRRSFIRAVYMIDRLLKLDPQRPANSWRTRKGLEAISQMRGEL
jgi:hypothetical protein